MRTWWLLPVCRMELSTQLPHEQALGLLRRSIVGDPGRLFGFLSAKEGAFFGSIAGDHIILRIALARASSARPTFVGRLRQSVEGGAVLSGTLRLFMVPYALVLAGFAFALSAVPWLGGVLPVATLILPVAALICMVDFFRGRKRLVRELRRVLSLWL